VPLDDDLQKQGLASRSEFANLQAGGRGFESHHLHPTPPQVSGDGLIRAITCWWCSGTSGDGDDDQDDVQPGAVARLRAMR